MVKTTSNSETVMLWHDLPERLELQPGEVHLWLANLDEAFAVYTELEPSLSDYERERYDRFLRREDRLRMSLARGLLRGLVGRYLGIEPGRVKFLYNRRGKPKAAWANFYFNLSHSSNLVLYAFSRLRVGVDLEDRRRPVDHLSVTHSFFSPIEAVWLENLPEDKRVDAFFRAWTLKEAFLKGIGSGLTRRLDQVAVDFLPGEPAALRSVEGAPEEANRWSLHDWEPAPQFTAALAVRGTLGTLDRRKIVFS